LLVHDTWAARDLPVLDATIILLEQSYMVTVTDIAARTGLDVTVVAKALEALDPVYVDFRKTTTGGDPRFWYVFKATPEARRAVGQWPTAEALVSRLTDELSVAARQETDAERQGLLTYAARLIGDTLRQAAVRAAGQVLAPAFGGVPQPEMGAPVPQPPAQEELDFASLVPLPELPELLRPDKPVAGASAPPSPSRPAPEPVPRSEPAPQPEPVRQPEAVRQPEPESGPAHEPMAAVPDLNPWPEPAAVPAPESAAHELEPLPEPTPFPTSLPAVSAAAISGPGAAAVTAADPDSADTDLDLAQSRAEAAGTI
jgi:hypothetical protein